MPNGEVKTIEQLLENHIGYAPYDHNSIRYELNDGKIVRCVVKDTNSELKDFTIFTAYDKFFVIEPFNASRRITELCSQTDIKFVAEKIYPYLKRDIRFKDLMANFPKRR